MTQIRVAAERDVIPDDVLAEEVQRRLGNVFVRLVDRAGMLKQHPGVPRFTIEQVRPELRAELDRRIMASVGLVKLNQQEATERTLKRFAGWATSIRPAAIRKIAKQPAKSDIAKSLRRLRYERRLVDNDQGHKLVANLNEILARGSGAICAIWQHHYDRYPRPVHLARHGKAFLIKGSWADEQGFVKPGEDGYYDDIEKPGQLVNCRCGAVYLTLAFADAGGDADRERSAGPGSGSEGDGGMTRRRGKR